MADTQSGEILKVDTLLESSLDSVEAAEASVLKVAGDVGFDEDSRHEIGMAVRESMVNAVVHGNRYNARKKVHLRIFLGANHLAVVIADEGSGFEVQKIPDPTAAENLLRQSGRGLLLIQAFMDEVVLGRRDPTGTEVRMVKYLAQAS